MNPVAQLSPAFTIAIGSRVFNSASNLPVYVDANGVFAQNANFYFDPANIRIGLGTTSPQGPLHAIGAASGSNYVTLVKNTATDGTAGYEAVGDTGSFSILGYGGSTRSDLLQSASFLFSSAGDTAFVNNGSNVFRWAIGGTSSTNERMKLTAGALTLGLAGTALGSVVLSGSTSGVVTVQPAVAAGTWTLTLPSDHGTANQVLQTDGSGVTSWATASGGGSMAIGSAVTSGTGGSVLYIDGSANLAQDNANFFWDTTNHRLGIGTASPGNPLEIVKSAGGASLVGNVKNTDSSGNSAWRVTNDLGRLCEYGFGGSTVGGLLGNAAYLYSSAGGMVFVSQDSSPFLFYQGSTSVLTIDALGRIGVGTTSPQGPIDLLGTVNGGNLVIRIQNKASDGTCAIQALEVNNNFCLFGYGGASRGDNLADRGYIYSQNGGLNISAQGDNVIEFTVNGIGTGNRVLAMQASKIGFLGKAPQAQQTSAADLTNNVTSGGTSDTIANFTDLTTYANDSAAIRNDIYQLARKVKQVNDALRTYGLLS